MKFRFLLLVLAVLAAALLVASVAHAFGGGPDVSCSPVGCGGDPGSNPPCAIGKSYAGFSHAQPAIGSSAAAIMGEYFDQLWNGGFVAGWVGVASAQRDSHGPLRWLQAGLVRDTTGLAFYIEVRTAGTWPTTHRFPVYSYTAQYSTQYIFTLYHNGSGVWTASIKTYPGNVLLYSDTENVAVDNAQFMGEADNTTSTCNVMEFAFWAMTWTWSQMPGPTNDYPYWEQNGSHGNDFTAIGP